MMYLVVSRSRPGGGGLYMSTKPLRKGKKGVPNKGRNLKKGQGVTNQFGGHELKRVESKRWGGIEKIQW